MKINSRQNKMFQRVSDAKSYHTQSLPLWINFGKKLHIIILLNFEDPTTTNVKILCLVTLNTMSRFSPKIAYPHSWTLSINLSTNKTFCQSSCLHTTNLHTFWVNTKCVDSINWLQYGQLLLYYIPFIWTLPGRLHMIWVGWWSINHNHYT